MAQLEDVTGASLTLILSEHTPARAGKAVEFRVRLDIMASARFRLVVDCIGTAAELEHLVQWLRTLAAAAVLPGTAWTGFQPRFTIAHHAAGDAPALHLRVADSETVASLAMQDVDLAGFVDTLAVEIEKLLNLPA